MSVKPQCHKDLIRALGGPSDLARLLGIWKPSPPTLHWIARGIPARYWPAVGALAAAKGIPITVHDLPNLPRTCELAEAA